MHRRADIDKSGEDPVVSALRPYGAPDDDDGSSKDSVDVFQKYFGNISQINHPSADFTTEDVSLLDHLLNVEHSYNNDTQRMTMDDANAESSVTNETFNENDNVTVPRPTVHEDIVTKFLRLIETQHLLGDNCTAGTHLNLGEGVVDRYAQERFRIEADVAVNRANMLTRLWKYAGPSVMHNEYLLHASVFSMVEFDDDIFAAGNCYDQYQYKDYQLFCPFAYRLPEGPILAKDLAVEYKYLSNTSEWFYIARKNAERVIRNHNQFRRGYNTYTYNDTAHTDREPDEILSVTYEDGKWSKPYYDCGGGNIWMLTYTVPFFGYSNGTYFFNTLFWPDPGIEPGTSGAAVALKCDPLTAAPPRHYGSYQLKLRNYTNSDSPCLTPHNFHNLHSAFIMALFIRPTCTTRNCVLNIVQCLQLSQIYVSGCLSVFLCLSDIALQSDYLGRRRARSRCFQRRSMGVVFTANPTDSNEKLCFVVELCFVDVVDETQHPANRVYHFVDSAVLRKTIMESVQANMLILLVDKVAVTLFTNCDNNNAPSNSILGSVICFLHGATFVLATRSFDVYAPL
ncbi:hypothetical protein ABMA27_006411 [Loxostege sticticalis]|uniref:Uncharacterized protein n=2 Tax=Loxostege sticticalis TaxID=481309 RepID=A0ABR3IJ35_LOXSC